MAGQVASMEEKDIQDISGEARKRERRPLREKEDSDTLYFKETG